MILNSLNLSDQDTNKRATKVVPVPCFGKDAEVVVTKMTVAGYLRVSRLQSKIREMEDLDETRQTGLFMCADLISVIIDPETGDFLLKESDLDLFHERVDRQSLDNLLSAHGELNPPKEIKPFETKKKTS